MATRGDTVRVRAGRRSVPITHASRQLFGDAGVDKERLARYYADVAPLMLPHLRERPIHIRAYPQGIDGDGFVHKSLGSHYPDWIDRATLPKREGGEIEQVVAGGAATLAYLAGQNAVSFHGWLSRRDRIECPDMLVIDLDPTGDDFGEVREAARIAHDVLGELGLPAFLKTTGSRGLHVVTPLDRRDDFELTRKLSRGIATLIAARSPELLTVETRKAKRKGRLFVDAMRNGYAQTAVVAYSVRARPDAPVSRPIGWEALATTGPRDFTLLNAEGWLGEEDPWAGFRSRAHRGSKAMPKLERLLEAARSA